jgi:phosphoglycolate phosphatase-like HAD superfamily hydrolase
MQNSNRDKTLTVPLDNISTIFFDFGNTLGYSTRSVSEVWVEAAVEHGLVLQQDILLEAMMAADQIYNPKVYEYRGRMPEFWGLYDAFVLDRLGIADRDGSLSRAVNSAFLDAEALFRVFPETHSVLSELKKRGYVLGTISNNTDEMLDRMKSLDLTRYFDTIRHFILLRKIARRVEDPDVLHLVKQIIKAGGKIGVPQGGPFSPLAANIYLNEVDWYFDSIRQRTTEGEYRSIYTKKKTRRRSKLC